MRNYEGIETFGQLVKNFRFISLENIEDLTIFSKVGKLMLPEKEDASDFEEDLEIWIQKIDSNPIIFGYIQYIEVVFDQLIEQLGEKETKYIIKTIMDLTSEDCKKLVDPIKVYREQEAIHKNTDTAIFDPRIQTIDTHIEMINHLCDMIAKYGKRELQIMEALSGD